MHRQVKRIRLHSARDIVKIFGECFYTANGQRMEVTGKTVIPVKLMVGGLPTTINSLCVPSLKVNLLSVRSLLKRGKQVVFKNYLCKILGKGRVVAVAEGTSFVLQTDEQQRTGMRATTENSELCHRRLGHVCANYMKKLANKIGETEQLECEVCALGKLKRLPLPRSTSRTSGVLDLGTACPNKAKLLM